MMRWIALRNDVDPETLGFVPSFLKADDPRPAARQFHDRYGHGGGWIPFKGFKFNPDSLELTYPGDDPLRALAFTTLRGESILMFEHGWVVVVQANGDWEVSRMD